MSFYNVVSESEESTVVSEYKSEEKRSDAYQSEEELEKEGVFPTREEGVKEGRWAVIDYGDVIVHVFNDETRLLYHLENLWGDDGNVKKY